MQTIKPKLAVCPGLSCAKCPAHLVDESGQEVGCALGGDCAELSRSVTLGEAT